MSTSQLQWRLPLACYFLGAPVVDLAEGTGTDHVAETCIYECMVCKI